MMKHPTGYSFLSIILFIYLFVSSLTTRSQSISRPGTFPDPGIEEILQEINEDSLATHIAFLQNMGTRYQYAQNRRQVAEWIAARFRSYGVTDVKLDSFRLAGDTIPTDSVWQYNVVATLTGTSAPDEIYILGAHHDAYSDTNLYLFTPGANDNGSGCALVFEFARICQKTHYQPASTIRLITFAAEELMSSLASSGSINYALRMHQNQEDLRLMINNDMIAYAPPPGGALRGTVFPDGPHQWCGELTLFAATYYSTIAIQPAIYPTSDASRFSELGYPVAGLESVALPPGYHSIHDSLTHCQMDLVSGACRLISAILLTEQQTPIPQYLSCTLEKKQVSLSWQSTNNHRVSGYRIYRSDHPDSGYVFLGYSEASHPAFVDSSLLAGKTWYYRVTTIDRNGSESLPSTRTKGALVPHDRDLLVVQDSKGGYLNPSDETVLAYYQALFSDWNAAITDASETDSLDIVVLGRYRKLFWLSNTYSNQPGSIFRKRQEDIVRYLMSGGQLFLAAFQPSFLTIGNIAQNRDFSPDETIWSVYKIASVERKPSAFLNGALPAVVGYDTLHVDPDKTPDNPAGHLPNVECITPTPDAMLIYRFNSSFDSTTSAGSMKGKPVGIEYLSSDYNLILLSVPLYYLDSSDAIALVSLVMREKFTSFTGETEPLPTCEHGIRLHPIPNPAHGSVTITMVVPTSSPAFLSLLDLTGQSRLTITVPMLSAGTNHLTIPLDRFSPGVYLVHLRTEKGSEITKLIVR